MNKTCGECKHYIAMSRCILYRQFVDDDDCCDSYTPKPQPITNGDKIMQGGNKRLITFSTEWSCFHCAYRNGIKSQCERPEGKDCFDGIEEWLNAPAESEGEDE